MKGRFGHLVYPGLGLFVRPRGPYTGNENRSFICPNWY